MARLYTCHDCGRQTEGTALSKGTKSAICPDCVERRKEGKEPAHVRKDAQKLRKRPQTPPAPKPD